MKKSFHILKHLSLLGLAVLALLLFYCVEKFAVVRESFPYTGLQYRAEALAQSAFDLIREKKAERGLMNPDFERFANGSVLGNEFTEMTSTLGSLEAKRISINPEFAGLIVRWLHETDLSSDHKAGVLISGSFPGLAVSVLSALETMNIPYVLISSLAASMYGANQPDFTWADMEGILNEAGIITSHSRLITPGGENDNGGGLMEEGVAAIIESAMRNGTDLFFPRDIGHAIAVKDSILEEEKISLLINIGGNQSSLGTCAHAAVIPNGFNKDYKTCNHEGRGLITRMSERGIPFIHLLEIKKIASRYDMDLDPGNRFKPSRSLHYHTETDKKTAWIGGLFILCLIYPFRKIIHGEKN